MYKIGDITPIEGSEFSIMCCAEYYSEKINGSACIFELLNHEIVSECDVLTNLEKMGMDLIPMDNGDYFINIFETDAPFTRHAYFRAVNKYYEEKAQTYMVDKYSGITYSTDEVAYMMHVTTNTVCKWAKTGKLEYVSGEEDYGRWRFSEEALKKFCSQNKKYQFVNIGREITKKEIMKTILEIEGLLSVLKKKLN